MTHYGIPFIIGYLIGRDLGVILFNAHRLRRLS